MTLRVGSSGVDASEILLQIYLDRLQTVPDGSGASHYGGPSGWIFGLDMVRINAHEVPALRRAIARLRKTVQVGTLIQTMVNRLHAGRGELRPHRDGPPNMLRFHLPLVSNSDAYWWDEINGREHMRVGEWYGPVPYCGVLHAAGNNGTTDRIHVVCDFERRADDARNVRR